MRKLIPVIVAGLAMLTGPAYATVIGTVNLSNGTFQYDENGGLTLPNLPGDNYYATLSADYDWAPNSAPPAGMANYFLNVNLDFDVLGSSDSFNKMYVLGVHSWSDLENIGDACFDTNQQDGHIQAGLKGSCPNSDFMPSGQGGGTDLNGPAQLSADQTVSSVPEPGMLALLGLGLLGAGIAVRRRRHA